MMSALSALRGVGGRSKSRYYKLRECNREKMASQTKTLRTSFMSGSQAHQSEAQADDRDRSMRRRPSPSMGSGAVGLNDH